MKKSIFLKLASILLLSFFIFGCSDKNANVTYNLTAQQWYKEILQNLKDLDFDAADKNYISFSSEHVSSPLLETMLLILAQTNIDEGNYDKAIKYLNEYIRRYGTYDKIEFAEFLKIKANYESFNQPNRNQGLMEYSISEIVKFTNTYPNSKYLPLIETMQLKFKLAREYLNMNIKKLYQRQGKTVSEKIYEEKLKNSGLKDANLQPPILPWYRAIFE